MLPPRLTVEAAAAFDADVLAAVCRLHRLELDAVGAWRSVQHTLLGLPISDGGLGLRPHAVHLPDMAYVAGVLEGLAVARARWPAVQVALDDPRWAGSRAFGDLCEAWEATLAVDNAATHGTRVLAELAPDGLRPATLPEAGRHLQRRLTTRADAHALECAFTSANAEQKAWLHSISGPVAGAWLLAFAGTHRLSDAEFDNAVQRRLYAVLPCLRGTSAGAADGKCPAIAATGAHLPCGKPCDLRGDHLTTCTNDGGSGGSKAVHNAVVQAVAKHGHAPALGAGLTLTNEQAMRAYVRSRHHDVDIRKSHANQTPSMASDESVTRNADGQRTYKAPDGITPSTTRGDVWFDVTITEPRGTGNMQHGAANKAGAAAAASEAIKRRAYAPAIRDGVLAEDRFIPLAFETGGRAGQAANEHMYNLAREYEARIVGAARPAQKLGRFGNVFLNQLRQAVSCALQGALSRKMLGVAPAAARGRGGLECFSPVDLAAADTALGG